MTMSRTAVQILEFEEGWRESPYYCSEGYPTVGYGFKIGDKSAPLPVFTLPQAAGTAWLQELVGSLAWDLRDRMGSIKLNDRRAVIISMCYQLGINGCFAFRKMWEAIDREDWSEAANQMLDSKWARQTPARAHRHATVMETGSIVGVY